MGGGAQSDGVLGKLPVLAWLLPLVHLLRRAGRRSILTWNLALVDVIVIAVLTTAAVESRDDPEWIGHLGREPVAVLGFDAVPRDQTLVVVAVSPGSPADEAGLKPGDAILTIDDDLVFDGPMVERRVQPRPIGTTFDVLVRRDQRNHMLEIRSGPRWQVSKGATVRVAMLRLATVVVVVCSLLGLPIVMWRRKAERAWMPLVVLGLLVGQGMLSDRIDTALAALCTALVAGVLVRRFHGSEQRTPPGLTVKTSLGVVLALPIVALRGFLVGLVVAYLLDVPFPDLGTASVFEAATPWLTTAVAVPVMEELVFRGLLLPAAARAMRPWVALVLTSLAFGGLHCLGSTNPGAATAYGFALGYLRLRTGRILPCILVHAALNAVALALGMA